MNNKPIDIEDGTASFFVPPKTLATLPINMHEINPVTFAKQLTLFNEDYWNKVAPLDLLDPKRQADVATPIGTLYDNFNRFEIWNFCD